MGLSSQCVDIKTSALGDPPSIWIKRIRFDGLRSLLSRRAIGAKEAIPTPHDFRRAFTLSMHRKGADLYMLTKLLGHKGITVLQRYLKQTYHDTEAAYRRAGHVDNSKFFGLG